MTAGERKALERQERRQRILAAFDNGDDSMTIAVREGISQSRVYQIVRFERAATAQQEVE